ncbi:MAG: UDP-4-amino-4,6-dideoxy-N-acetyl-beta-L-altrosamine transaminase [Candidatus Tectomicrobia bacterium]|uniref:UDP-4-amino-4, 6-dideoxy-N-acetyl-beta-L-altrosamine transaminase n=1 Tax=Tectimicrobiota bacterium TaxID=2528274 RepID=A0A933GKX7_UNCTE|nr:UDP-4-amino-4,6-dideoxy-N-acetyl-beta-L-altrosamine transaminase [Candidatus Tectomicrobia bacterium]
MNVQNSLETIPYGRQWIEEDDIQAVVEVLRSDWLTQGPKVKEFEEYFAGYVGARYAVAVCNGTAALHCAYLAAGIGPGDEVITTPITFAATANAAFYCGARPYFVDIDPNTYNLDPEKLKRYLRGKRGDTPKAVVPVHMAGLPCEMEKIQAIAQEYNLLVIEDACHALGAQYQARTGSVNSQNGRGNAGDWSRVGSCRHSDMSVFSFHPVKHITCGEGGMITTNSKELYDRLLLYRNHGITHEVQHPLFHDLDSRFYCEMKVLGFNFRMNDIQGALGLSQLKKVDQWVKRRRDIASQYLKAFADLGEVRLPYTNGCTLSAYHLFLLQVKHRSCWLSELQSRGIRCQVHYLPLPLHPFYRQKGYDMDQLPEAGSYYEKCLSIPIFPKMTDEQTRRVMEAIKTIGGSGR